MITFLGRGFRAPSNLTRLVLLAVLSVLLMIMDHEGQHLQKIRSTLGVLASPIPFVAALPARVSTAVSNFFASEQELKQDLEALREERLQLLARLQRLEVLEAENNRLRSMLGSAARVAARVLAADLMEVSLEPFTRKIVIARGTKDEVYVAQPVIDAHGIMGQITQVSNYISYATLITDPGHAIPVMVNRNGLRTIVFGTGDQDAVSVPYLTSASDIREGDLLISSGMGGVFPPGYPVAVVTRIANDPNEAFLEITAKPAAQINHSKQVLLIWTNQAGALETAREHRP